MQASSQFPVPVAEEISSNPKEALDYPAFRFISEDVVITLY
jgi:hypothetical protein